MADNRKKNAAKKAKTQAARARNTDAQMNPKPQMNNTGDNFSQSTFSVVIPYVLMVFAVVLAICFFTVQLLGIDDGAGVIGYAMQWFFCGLLGTAAFLLPLVLFYIGLKKCVYNVKCSSNSSSKTVDSNERAAQRKRVTTVIIASSIFIVAVSVLFGVLNNYESFDIADMWSEAADAEALLGGLIGSSLGMLMVMCFEKVISVVLLAVLLVGSFVFAIGLTPSLVIEKIRERREINKQMRALEEEEIRRLEAEAEAEARKHKNRIAVTQLRTEEEEDKPTRNTRKNMSVDELLSEEDDNVFIEEPEIEYKPLGMGGIYATPSQNVDKIYIGTDGAVGKIDATKPEEKNDVEVGEDFGGDPSFDTNEYAGIQSVIDGLGAKQATPKKSEMPAPKDDVVEIVQDLEGGVADAHINLEKIENEELLSEMAAVAPEEGQEEVEVITPYVFPPVDMLTANPNSEEEDFSKELNENAQNLLATLSSFRVSIDAITYSRGPTITRYELKPAAGTRVRAIANLVDDIALSLATTGVRIEAPIPNKPAVGIEVPNRTRATVYLRDLIDSPKFFESKSRLTACLGMDVGGNPIYFDISKMPHLLIAGATGMGKSVCINTIIVSLLYKAKPDELKLILIDPKKVEFTMYKNIPHLYAPIVSDPKKAAGALASAVAEMERRFELIEAAGVRDIAGYNAVTENDPDREFMPHMVIIIDELADLMMTAPDEVETSICRLAQKARAAGIHIIIGTQRPSVDVITGLIKANIPSRIACTVASQTDSRTILDIAGAEKLIGRGDMLFAPVGASKPMRVQGAFVSEGEVENIVTYIRDNNAAGKFNSEFIHRIEEEAAKCGMGKKGAQAASFDSDDSENEGGDSKFNEAVKLAIEEGKISTSLMQRRLGVGYGRAAKIIDAMEERGYVSKPDGNKPRRVLITMEEYMRRKMDNELDDIPDDEF